MTSGDVMNALTQFVAMHGYACYVWPAFGLTLGDLTLQLICAWRDYSHLVKQLKQQRRGQHASHS